MKIWLTPSSSVLALPNLMCWSVMQYNISHWVGNATDACACVIGNHVSQHPRPDLISVHDYLQHFRNISNSMRCWCCSCGERTRPCISIGRFWGLAAFFMKYLTSFGSSLECIWILLETHGHPWYKHVAPNSGDLAHSLAPKALFLPAPVWPRSHRIWLWNWAWKHNTRNHLNCTRCARLRAKRKPCWNPTGSLRPGLAEPGCASRCFFFLPDVVYQQAQSWKSVLK